MSRSIKNARAAAQLAAMEELQKILDPGSTVYWIQRWAPGCDKNHIYLDPVALSGSAPIYLRELVAVLGPYKMSAIVPALEIADTKDPNEGVTRAMARLRAYVHVEAGLPMPIRWL